MEIEDEDVVVVAAAPAAVIGSASLATTAFASSCTLRNDCPTACASALLPPWASVIGPSAVLEPRHVLFASRATRWQTPKGGARPGSERNGVTVGSWR